MPAEVPSHPTWPVPPEGGYTVDDLFNLPDLPPHTELIDGSLVFVSPQRDFHSLVMYVLEHGLRRTVPEEYRVRREMTVVIDRKQCPEPDVSVVRREAVTGPDVTSFPAADVLLAVEVMSPDSEKRDRERIRHFWRVESDKGRPVVYVYELDDATQSYVPTGIYHDQLKLKYPFTIDIDLTEIDKL
jgi:Uma2 family endonuclease